MFKHLRFALVIAFMATVTAAPGAAASAERLLQLQRIDNDVYALVGPLGNRSAENLGNNATFGMVVTDEGVVLIDPGGTYDGAAVIHDAIKTVTDKPVTAVINTGGQDHRWLGNGYFKERGARIIASKQAVEDQRERVQDQFFMLGNLVGEKAVRRTDPVYADETFDERLTFTMGGVDFELFHVGPAHTPGDALVWLPEKRIVFTGDVVYVERMLGVIPVSDSRNWIKALERLIELEPQTLVPGHGSVTDLARAQADTLDYLRFLREAVADYMEGGGDIMGISGIEQSRFDYLYNYDTLHGRNAQQVFQELEWE